MDRNSSSPGMLVAWAGGFFDGEGCISLTKRKTLLSACYLRLTLVNTDEETVRKFAQVVSAGYVYGPARTASPHHRPLWTWHARGSRDIRLTWSTISPWLGNRRLAQFQEKMTLAAPRVQYATGGQGFQLMPECLPAWAAGIFEAEGCVSVNRSQPRATVVNTDRQMLARFHSILGMGTINGPYCEKAPRRTPWCQWTVHGRSAVWRLWLIIHPWLSQRRLTQFEAAKQGTKCFVG
jgi:hypothetical protein